MTNKFFLLLIILSTLFIVSCGNSNKIDFRAVTFSSDTGELYTTQYVTYGDTIEQFTPPAKPGYHFDGWTNGGTRFNPTTAITADIDLVAIWLQLYTVEFYSDNTFYDNKSVADGYTVSKPTVEPTKTGYVFTEWEKSGLTFDFNSPIIADTRLDAKWEQAITVKFDVDGVTVATEIIASGATVQPPTPPTKTGYRFDEWQNGGATFNFTLPITADITLDAKFTKMHIVTFHVDGNFYDNSTAADGGTVSAPTPPTKTGYRFDEWQNGGAAFNFSSAITTDITLDAKFTKIHTVTFNVDGAYYDNITVADGGTVSQPTPPTKLGGYRFVRWQNGISPFSFSSAITADITLDAVFVKQYTVSFYDDISGTLIESKLVDTNTTVTAPASTPTKTGHTFVGWTKSDLTDFSLTTNITEDTDLYAKFTVNVTIFTVAYTSNGIPYGSESVNNGDYATGPATEPTKPDYYFVEWRDSGTNNKFDLASTPITGNINLYAYFKAGNAIRTIADLQAIQPAKNYVLLNDIDLGTLGTDWTPIPILSGTFEGDNFTIKNLVIDPTDRGYGGYGLFAEIQDGTVKGLNITIGCNVGNSGYTSNTLYEKSNIGGLVGKITQGTGSTLIERVSVQPSTDGTCNVNADKWIKGKNYVGGIVGQMDNGTIRESFTTVDVHSYAPAYPDSQAVGGIAGKLQGANSLITQSYTTGTITNNLGVGVGGVVGQIDSSTVSYVYASGDIVSQAVYAGGVVGYGNATRTSYIKYVAALGARITGERSTSSIPGRVAGFAFNSDTTYTQRTIYTLTYVYGYQGLFKYNYSNNQPISYSSNAPAYFEGGQIVKDKIQNGVFFMFELDIIGSATSTPNWDQSIWDIKTDGSRLPILKSIAAGKQPQLIPAHLQ